MSHLRASLLRQITMSEKFFRWSYSYLRGNEERQSSLPFKLILDGRNPQIHVIRGSDWSDTK